MAAEWFVNQPALVPTCVSLGAQHGPHFFAGVIDNRPVDWEHQDLAQIPVRPLRRAMLPTVVQPNPAVLTTPDIQPLSWQGEQPDIISRKRPFHGGWIAKSHFDTFPPPVLWPSATYSDWIPARKRAPYTQYWSTPIPETNAIEPWLSRFPAFIDRKQTHASQMPFFWLGSYGYITQGLPWRGRYPDRHQYPAYRPFNIEANIEPIPTPAAPELSWQPFFNDMAPKATVHVSRIPASWWNTETPPRVPYEWSIQHQMPVLRMRRPEGTMVAGQPVPAAEPLAWEGSYPAFVLGKKMPLRPSSFATPEGSQISIQTMGWRYQQPTMFTQYRYPSWFILPFFADPTSIAGTYECIKMKDADVYSSDLEDETVKASTLTDESITPTIEEDFC